MSAYEISREQFDKLVKKYKDYIELYKFFNNGSIKGLTPFDVFYWRLTYRIRYEDPQRETTLRS